LRDADVAETARHALLGWSRSAVARVYGKAARGDQPTIYRWSSRSPPAGNTSLLDDPDRTGIEVPQLIEPRDPKEPGRRRRTDGRTTVARISAVRVGGCEGGRAG
jgi:hypothetical protein